MGFPNSSVGKKHPPVMQETQVQSFGGEDPLQKGMAIPSSTLDWKISWTWEPGGQWSMELQRVGHDRAIKPSHEMLDL